MPRRSHRPYKSFIRTLEKFFFSCETEERQGSWTRICAFGNMKIEQRWSGTHTRVLQSALQRRTLAGLEGSCPPLPAPGGKQILVQSKTCKNKCEESCMRMHRACDGWRAGPCSCCSWAHSEVRVCVLPVWQLHVFCFQCQASSWCPHEFFTLALQTVLWRALWSISSKAQVPLFLASSHSR